MTKPNISFYARFERVTSKTCKTPKYIIMESVGYYPPMQALAGKDGNISVYLMDKLTDGLRLPSMRLQAKNSLNLTGLKEWFNDGKLSGFAYGYPYSEATYSKQQKHNPFYEYKNDGFLFIIDTTTLNPTDNLPLSFEMIVIEKAKAVISALCKQLQMGGFESALQDLRELSRSI